MSVTIPVLALPCASAGGRKMLHYICGTCWEGVLPEFGTGGKKKCPSCRCLHRPEDVWESPLMRTLLDSFPHTLECGSVVIRSQADAHECIPCLRRVSVAKDAKMAELQSRLRTAEDDRACLQDRVSVLEDQNNDSSYDESENDQRANYQRAHNWPGSPRNNLPRDGWDAPGSLSPAWAPLSPAYSPTSPMYSPTSPTSQIAGSSSSSSQMPIILI
jgi:hypothetical protein